MTPRNNIPKKKCLLLFYINYSWLLLCLWGRSSSSSTCWGSWMELFSICYRNWALCGCCHQLLLFLQIFLKSVKGFWTLFSSGIWLAAVDSFFFPRIRPSPRLKLFAVSHPMHEAVAKLESFFSYWILHPSFTKCRYPRMARKGWSHFILLLNLMPVWCHV